MTSDAMKARQRKTRGGAPRKAPGGLGKVLFVRADEALLRKVERVRRIRSRRAGTELSTADVVRMLLVEGNAREADD